MSLMVPTADPPRASVATPTGQAYSLAWAILGVGAAGFLWVLWHVWMSLPEMNDRFLIPLAAAWLGHRNAPRWRAIPRRPAPAGLILVALGAVMAPPAWFLLVQVGPRVLLLWWLLGSLALGAAGLLIAQFGWRRAWQGAFPIAFCFL